MHPSQVLNTHIHADHVTGSGLIKGRLPGVKSVLGGGARYGTFGRFLTILFPPMLHPREHRVTCNA